MANDEQVKRLKEGVEAWNLWREKNPEVEIDLSGTNLRDANLNRADLRGANLSKSFFVNASLRGAKLIRTNLSHANFSHADLSDADLSGANLGGADLDDADLIRASLQFADLRRASLQFADLASADLCAANLSGAKIGSAGPYLPAQRHTNFGAIDLSQTKGLDDIWYNGPSMVSTSTLEKSRGKIPDVFLRCCGLSDWEIAAAKLHDPDLTSGQIIDLTYEIARIKAESPVNVNPIFISYSHENGDFVDALEPRFNKKRIRYWRDIHHSTAGPLEEIVDRAMRVNSVVLLILSEHSVESDWVEWEVEKAREFAKESKEHVLCPIALDDSWESCDWPDRLRRQVKKYNILDFSKWKNEKALAAAFQRLIDGLGIYYPKDVAAG